MRLGHYNVTALTVRYFVPIKAKGRTVLNPMVKKSPKSADEKTSKIPMTVHLIFLRDSRSGDVFRFTGTIRKRVDEHDITGKPEVTTRVVTFGDSRKSARNPERLTIEKLRVELSRYVGGIDAANIVVATMFENVQESSDVEGAIAELKAAIEQTGRAAIARQPSLDVWSTLDAHKRRKLQPTV